MSFHIEGKFCDKCQHAVVDFTKKPDEEMYQYLRPNNQRLGGRFDLTQLKSSFLTILALFFVGLAVNLRLEKIGLVVRGR